MHFALILGIIWLLLMCCTDPETRWEVTIVLGLLLWFTAQHTPTIESLLP